APPGAARCASCAPTTREERGGPDGSAASCRSPGARSGGCQLGTGPAASRPAQPGPTRSTTMAEAITVSTPISGTDKTLTFETAKLAFQSPGAVLASLEGTEALVTANAAKSVREGIDFSPLT